MADDDTRPAPPWHAEGQGWQAAWQRWRDSGDGQPPPEGGWGPPPGWRHGPGRWLRPREPGPLRRQPENRMVGGVASGIAARTGFDVTAVRIVFILAALASGFGLAPYTLAWLFVPAAGADSNIASKAIGDRRGIALAAGLSSVLVVILILTSALGQGRVGSIAWPLVIGAASLVLIWRNAPEDERATMRRLTAPLTALIAGRTRSPALWRLVIGIAVGVAGLVILQNGHQSPALLQSLGAIALVVAAIVVLLGPWWLRIARDLIVERQARARAEERADIAARVHDSVLQTLALIQRQADSPQRVVQLARAQERELRSWLFEGRAPGENPARTLADGVRLIQQEVETQHEVPVEAVTVGNCDLNDDLGALLAAAREATVNAAKWSGAAVVSLFAEVEPARVSVYVRDRGQGFDPAAVPADRKGLAESVHARMTRRGGTSAIRSTKGEGTEVALTMPREAGARPVSQP